MLGKVNEKLMKLTVFKITIIIIAITCTLRIKKKDSYLFTKFPCWCQNQHLQHTTSVLNDLLIDFYFSLII